MIPHPDSVFLLRLESNEMVERERFASLLSVIEQEIRSSGFAGRHAILVIGGVRQGSIEIILGIAGIVVSAALAIPGFIISLKQLAQDKDNDPNPFAVALGEVMAMDGVSRAEFRYKDVSVSISRDEVPFARSLQLSPPRTESASTVELTQQIEDPISDDGPIGVEDEDRDWLPTLEASESSPNEAGVAANGYLNSLSMVGEFEKLEEANGRVSLRFIPSETLLAPFFEVTSNNYQQEPDESVEYNVIGNVTLDTNLPATIEILSIRRSDDDSTPLRA